MHILFIISGTSARKHFWNGHTIRYGGVGVSGTDQSAVLYAEYLASQGHIVHYVSETCQRGTVYNDVLYSNLYPNDTSIYDAIVTTCNLPIPPQITFPNVKSLIIYCQCNVIPSGAQLDMFKQRHPDCRIRVVHVSEWGRQSTRDTCPHYDRYIDKDVVIYNPLMMDVLSKVPIFKKPKTFAFHAVWERGGNVAQEVFNRLGWERQGGKILAVDYDTGSKIMTTQKSILSEEKKISADKNEIAKLLAMADYFVYPLINSNPTYVDLIHKDTFGCCVAEALAMGVIVITWPVGAIPELYGGYAQFADFPSNSNIQSLKGTHVTVDPTLRSEEAIESILNVVNALENNPDMKEQIRKAGIEYARKTFDTSALGHLWNDVLTT